MYLRLLVINVQRAYKLFLASHSAIGYNTFYRIQLMKVILHINKGDYDT